VVTRLRDVQDGEGRRRLTAGKQQGPGAALEGCEALLDDRLRGVLDARVDVAELGEREEVGRVVGVVEDVRRGLVDRRRTSLGHRVGLGPRVDLLGLETPVLGCGHGFSCVIGCRRPLPPAESEVTDPGAR
jgi:hypothetical protein